MINIRKDFPIFSTSLYKAYLDNAATTHKPHQVIDAMSTFYATAYAPAHRSSYKAAEVATERYEQIRAQTASWLRAEQGVVVFTKGATEGINLVAYSWALNNLKKGDEIVITYLEHHANILPWQMVCQQTGARLVVVPTDAQGLITPDGVIKNFTPKTKLVAVSQSSHVFGTILPIEPIAQAIHALGGYLLVDAAQSAPHGLVDITTMEPDFLVFSAHKMMGPTGLGFLYIKKDIAEGMVPFNRGGGMVVQVDSLTAQWLKPPHRFEGGSLPTAQVMGWGAVLDYCNGWDWNQVRAHEDLLTVYAVERLGIMPSVTLLGPGLNHPRLPVISFTVTARHPHDIGTLFDNHAIAVRVGDHCAQPLMNSLGVPGTIRMSFFAYTLLEEIVYSLDILEDSLKSPSWMGF